MPSVQVQCPGCGAGINVHYEDESQIRSRTTDYGTPALLTHEWQIPVGRPQSGTVLVTMANLKDYKSVSVPLDYVTDAGKWQEVIGMLDNALRKVSVSVQP